MHPLPFFRTCLFQGAAGSAQATAGGGWGSQRDRWGRSWRHSTKAWVGQLVALRGMAPPVQTQARAPMHQGGLQTHPRLQTSQSEGRLNPALTLDVAKEAVLRKAGRALGTRPGWLSALSDCRQGPWVAGSGAPRDGHSLGGGLSLGSHPRWFPGPDPCLAERAGHCLHSCQRLPAAPLPKLANARAGQGVAACSEPSLFSVSRTDQWPSHARDREPCGGA